MAGYGEKDVSCGSGGSAGGDDEPPNDHEPSGNGGDDSDDGDDDLYGSDSDEDWLEVFVSNGTSTLVAEVMFKAIIYFVTTKWKIGNTRLMRFVNAKGNTMLPLMTISQNEVKHHSTLTLLFDGLGGASAKKRKPMINDLKVKTDDHTLVKACFALETFNERPWLQSLKLEQVKGYVEAMEKRQNFVAQVQATVELVREFKALKDWCC